MPPRRPTPPFAKALADIEARAAQAAALLEEEKPDFNTLAARHRKVFRNPCDEHLGIEPTCGTCKVAWPCDARRALDMAETARADVHHNANPALGMLRRQFDLAAHADPLDIPKGPNGLPVMDGLWPETPIKTDTLIYVAEALRRTTDAADAALGEEPMQVQIDRLQARLAAERAAS